jgi:hypothetical protein
MKLNVPGTLVLFAFAATSILSWAQTERKTTPGPGPGEGPVVTQEEGPKK